MARVKSKRTGKGKESGKKRKKKGPTSSGDRRKTKTIKEVTGIQPIQFSDESDDEKTGELDGEDRCEIQEFIAENLHAALSRTR